MSIILLFCTVFSANAVTISISLFWDYSNDYNIHDGSTIQLVMYTTLFGPGPGSNVNNNFDQIGTYNDEPVYDPYTVHSGHYLEYQTYVYADASGYHASINIVVLDLYNRLYLRIFEEHITPDMEITYSYWGLTPVVTRFLGFFPVSLSYNNFTGVTNHHQFGYNEPYFEVIPEPSTIRLIILGVLMFLGWKRCKYCYEH